MGPFWALEPLRMLIIGSLSQLGSIVAADVHGTHIKHTGDAAVHMALRAVASHSQYVNVLVVSTMYIGTLAGVALHTIVASTTSTWDAGASAVLLLIVGSFLWAKENHYDEHNGVHTTNSSIAILAAVVLVVVSEAALFISILWALVLVLVSHSVYIKEHITYLQYILYTEYLVSPVAYGTDQPFMGSHLWDPFETLLRPFWAYEGSIMLYFGHRILGQIYLLKGGSPCIYAICHASIL